MNLNALVQRSLALQSNRAVITNIIENHFCAWKANCKNLLKFTTLGSNPQNNEQVEKAKSSSRSVSKKEEIKKNKKSNTKALIKKKLWITSVVKEIEETSKRSSESSNEEKGIYPFISELIYIDLRILIKII